MLTSMFGPLIKQYGWLVLLMITITILKPFMHIIKGKIGEGTVNLAAKLRLDPNVYHMIKDVTIPARNGTTQIDHIIVSMYGLFVIETKNYKGWIFGSAKQKQWTQNNFGKKNRFQNPLHQNDAHICALEKLLGISKDKIHGVICFMGDAEFKTEIPEGVFIQGRYVNHIQSFKAPLFKPEEVTTLIQQIESGRFKRGHQTNRAHVQQLKKHALQSPKIAPPETKHQEQETQTILPASKTCPACGSEMILRTAKKGKNAGNPFWGCSAFPKCRKIVSVQPK